MSIYISDVQESALDNITATRPPTVNDDKADGYSAKSIWIDTVAGKPYVCLDATAGAAVWIDTSLSTDDLGNLAVQDKADIIDDTAYGATWNTNDDAATKNATYDKFQSVDEDIYNPNKVLYISSSGGDYTTIQAALDANTAGSELFYVGPGTYTNDTINFTANNQVVKGMGFSPANQLVTRAIGIICNFGSHTGCKIGQIKMMVTNATAATFTVQGSGSIILYRCHVGMATSNNISGVQPGCIGGSGTVKMVFGTLEYDNTGSSTGIIKAAVYSNSAINTELRRVIVDMDCSGTASHTTPAYALGSAVIKMNRCKVDVDDVNAATVVGFVLAGGVGIQEAISNEIHVTGASNNVCGVDVTGSGNIRLMYNHIHSVAPGGNAYSFCIASGSTLTSQFDDIIAANGYLNNGTLTMASSESDGNITATTGYRVGSNQVVGSQQAAETNIAVTGTHKDGDCRLKVNNILAKLRTHGLIA